MHAWFPVPPSARFLIGYVPYGITWNTCLTIKQQIHSQHPSDRRKILQHDLIGHKITGRLASLVRKREIGAKAARLSTCTPLKCCFLRRPHGMRGFGPLRFPCMMPPPHTASPAGCRAAPTFLPNWTQNGERDIFCLMSSRETVDLKGDETGMNGGTVLLIWWEVTDGACSICWSPLQKFLHNEALELYNLPESLQMYPADKEWSFNWFGAILGLHSLLWLQWTWAFGLKEDCWANSADQP